jgi:hypothetical protein
MNEYALNFVLEQISYTNDVAVMFDDKGYPSEASAIMRSVE